MRGQALVRGQCLDFLTFSWHDPFSVFIECATVLFLFYVLVFWPQGMWDLSSPIRDGTVTPCIGRKVLNIGPPRKFLSIWTWFTISHKHTRPICFSVSRPILYCVCVHGTYHACPDAVSALFPAASGCRQPGVSFT